MTEAETIICSQHTQIPDLCLILFTYGNTIISSLSVQ